MSILNIDKATLTSIVAAACIVAYLAFILIYPDKIVPEELKTVANIAIGWFFVTGSVSFGNKLSKTG